MLVTADTALPPLDSAPPCSARAVVDQLIAARAPHLLSTPGGRWFLREVLAPLLRYEEAVALAELVRPLPGRAIFRLLAERLALRLDVHGLEHLPARGPTILVANHPTGLADDIAVTAAVAPGRADLWLLVNADALPVAPGLAELVVPVEWVQAKRNRAGSRAVLLSAGKILGAGGVLVIFPAGRLSYLGWRGLAERAWQSAAIGLARRFGAPILPLWIGARNSVLFQILSRLGRELLDVTLFHELVNKHRRRFELRFSAPLERCELEGDAAEVTSRLQRFVEGGLRDRSLLRPMPASGLLAGLGSSSS